jgi:superfamily I DNA/RNA helicase
MEQIVFIGPPGTGKTTRLIEEVNALFEQGYSPREIAFNSFTNKAADEARERALERFSHLDPEDFLWWRTIHSCGFRACGMTPNDVMNKAHWLEIGEITGSDMDGRFDMDEGYLRHYRKEGDQFVFYNGIAEARMISPKALYDSLPNDAIEEIPRNKFLYFCEQTRKYKLDHGLYDYSDMISRGATTGPAPGVKVVFIDEAQDLSLAQWNFINSVYSEVDRMYIAGDDDQAIFDWSGADVETFKRLALSGNRITLNRSYRLPPQIFNMANKISGRISDRLDKIWTPNGEGSGGWLWEGYITAAVNRLAEDVRQHNGKTWMILARNKYLLNDVEEIVRGQGIPYLMQNGNRSVNEKDIMMIKAWEDLRAGRDVSTVILKMIWNLCLSSKTDIAHGHKTGKAFKDSDQFVNWEWCAANAGLLVNRDRPWWAAFSTRRWSERKTSYLRRLRKQGFRTDAKPQVYIGTIHSVKGGEADNVIILDEMAKRSYKSLSQGRPLDQDGEHRVAYVAATRARENVIVHRTMRDERYPYPR